MGQIASLYPAAIASHFTGPTRAYQDYPGMHYSRPYFERIWLQRGQAQRICIARGLLRLSALRQTKKDGILLLLDEPTSSLDTDTETEMLARLFSHVKGLTIVAVSHKTALQQFADNIIALNKRIHP